MQIVRDLGGYTLGRSDLLRRAMSKKKQYVMEQERANFIYGNEEQGVPGCVANGIDAQVADQIYNSMMDFAKYAFNKSHAACYAVVSYQTAYLKYYYPTEFMAALMTSVIDNPAKVAEYILTCRNMNIRILPPDINEGEYGFSVSGSSIRYGLSAIKSIGRPVIEMIAAERSERGPYKTLKDFVQRQSGKEINKRTVENFIKSGSFDGLGGTRKQFMTVYAQIMDSISQDKKNNLAGQLSLFDIVEDSHKEEFEIKLPDVGEYPKEVLLAFEKEVLGIYVSGHPLEEYEKMWKKRITAVTSDFFLDEETGAIKLRDRDKATIGGIITHRQTKYTKNGQPMAFLMVEDLVGTVEVIVWPNDYEKNGRYLIEESKVFISGRVSAEEDKDGKLICERVVPFDEVSKDLCIQFETKEDYAEKEEELLSLCSESDGIDRLVIYTKTPSSRKILPPNRNVRADRELVERLAASFGKENVRVI